MFAYCLNSPILYADSSGTRAVPRDPTLMLSSKPIDNIPTPSNEGENTNISNSDNDVLTQLFLRYSEINSMQILLEHEIRTQQIQLIQDVSKDAWDLYVLSVELEERTYQEQIQQSRKRVQFFIENPMEAATMAANIIGFETSYVGLLATTGVASISTGGQIVLGAIGLGCTIWGATAGSIDTWKTYFGEVYAE